MFTIKNALVLYGEDMEALKANVVIEDDIITEITTENITIGEKIDAKGCILTPALVNSHIHLGDSVAKDVGDGQNIDKIVKPPKGLKHRILTESDPSEIVDSMRKSMWDMISNGTGTFVDFREGGFEGLSMFHEASEDVPIRKIVLGRHESFFDPDVERSYAKKIIRKLLRRCDGIAPSGFGEIRDDVASLIAETCRKKSKISAIHVAEYEELQKESIRLTGKSEVQRAINSGFDLLVHLTSPIKDDLKLIANSQSSVVCCPRSNGILSAGIPPIKEIFDNRINMLLGTDNIMFNSPNMLTEMEYALKVTRGYYKEYFAPVEVLKMATINAARTLNLNSGCIMEGKKADILMVKQVSKDPILSLINRTESKSITGLIIEGDVIFKK